MPAEVEVMRRALRALMLATALVALTAAAGVPGSRTAVGVLCLVTLAAYARMPEGEGRD